MRQPDWLGLSELDPVDQQQALLDWLQEAMHDHYGHEDEDEILARFAEPLRVLWVLNWLDFEVTMGSFLAYFGNKQRGHAGAVIESLRMLGAMRTASVVERATRVFDAHHSVWEARDKEIDELGQYAVVQPYVDLPGVDELSQLTDEYYEEEKRERWRARLSDYLHRSIRELALSESGPD